MTTARPIGREIVYSTIDGEINYAVRRWKDASDAKGITHREDADKMVEEWLIFIAGYYQDALWAASHEAGHDGTLDVFRKLAALCVRCMETNGIVYRPVGNTNAYITPVSNRATIYDLIDRERGYQDALPPTRTDGRRHTPCGYLVMFDTYLRRAIDGWTSRANDAVALDNIRKLAAIAVRCMEEHGAPRRTLSPC